MTDSHSDFHFLPACIAHRGASALAPENTMIAFSKAAQMGVKWIEFDVHLAACGEIVIFHDEHLERTTDGQGKLKDFSYTYLQTLDAGKWFHPLYAGERIPNLATIIPLLRAMHLYANIEIKAPHGQEEAIVKRLLQEVPQDLPILYSSFSFKTLACLRVEAPQAKLGYVMDNLHRNWQADCMQLNCFSVHVNATHLTKEKVAEIKSIGKKALCFTVNDAKEAQQWWNAGVDAVFTDDPSGICPPHQQGGRAHFR